LGARKSDIVEAEVESASVMEIGFNRPISSPLPVCLLNSTVIAACALSLTNQPTSKNMQLR